MRPIALQLDITCLWTRDFCPRVSVEMQALSLWTSYNLGGAPELTIVPQSWQRCLVIVPSECCHLIEHVVTPKRELSAHKPACRASTSVQFSRHCSLPELIDE
jgi:hypothetical protein